MNIYFSFSQQFCELGASISTLLLSLREGKKPGKCKSQDFNHGLSDLK